MRSVVEISHPLILERGKKEFMKLLETVLQQIVNIFRDENVCSNDNIEEGHTFLNALCEVKCSKQILDYLRFYP